MPDFELSLFAKELTLVNFDPLFSITFFSLYHLAVKSCQVNRAKHAFTSKNLLITVINALVFSKLHYNS